MLSPRWQKVGAAIGVAGFPYAGVKWLQMDVETREALEKVAPGMVGFVRTHYGFEDEDQDWLRHVAETEAARSLPQPFTVYDPQTRRRAAVGSCPANAPATTFLRADAAAGSSSDGSDGSDGGNRGLPDDDGGSSRQLLPSARSVDQFVRFTDLPDRGGVGGSEDAGAAAGAAGGGAEAEATPAGAPASLFSDPLGFVFGSGTGGADGRSVEERRSEAAADGMIAATMERSLWDTASSSSSSSSSSGGGGGGQAVGAGGGSFEEGGGGGGGRGRLGGGRFGRGRASALLPDAGLDADFAVQKAVRTHVETFGPRAPEAQRARGMRATEGSGGKQRQRRRGGGGGGGGWFAGGSGGCYGADADVVFVDPSSLEPLEEHEARAP